jgi:hypothetical protein
MDRTLAGTPTRPTVLGFAATNVSDASGLFGQAQRFLTFVDPSPSRPHWNKSRARARPAAMAWYESESL